MFAYIKRAWLSYLCIIIVFGVVGYLNYTREVLFFIAVILLLIYGIIFTTIITPVYIIINNAFKLKDVEISFMKKPVNFFVGLCLGIEIQFFLALIFSGKFTVISIGFFTLNAISCSIFLRYLWVKYQNEAKKQKIELNSITLRQVYSEIYSILITSNLLRRPFRSQADENFKNEIGSDNINQI